MVTPIIKKKKKPDGESVDMNLVQFIQNPTGPGSAVYFKREAIKAALRKGYSSLIKKYRDFKLSVYRPGPPDTYLFHFKVPSEKYDGLLYDVCIQFEPMDDPVDPYRPRDVSAARSSLSVLSRYKVRLFSNSPNFVFTYAYVLSSKGMLVELLKKKLGRKALTMPPSVRNPVESLGFEKSTYYAGMHILYRKLHVKKEIESLLKPSFNEKEFLAGIASDADKLAEYAAHRKREARKARKEREAKRAEKEREAAAARSVSRIAKSARRFTSKMAELEKRKKILDRKKASKKARDAEKIAIQKRRVERQRKSIKKLIK